MSLDFDKNEMNWDVLETQLKGPEKKEKKNFKDDRFWTLSRDENDNGGALIRLLPDPDGKPWIEMFSHAIKSYDGTQKSKYRWYLRSSPDTIGQPCPASDLWKAIYNVGTDEAKEEARGLSRKLNFYTNIKIIKDPANPENEGKIMLWKFGTKLKDRFVQALKPTQADLDMGEQPKQLFNPLTGNNIKLRIKKAGGFLNYDDTSIAETSSIYENSEEAKKDIIENAYKLSEFLEPDQFETYEELLKSLTWVMEKYEAQKMDKALFQSIVDNVLKGTEKEIPKATDSVDSGLDLGTVDTPEAAAPTAKISIEEEAPREEVKKVDPKPSDADLDFLDDL